jgi:DNA transposition AAA+ family ATPase
MNQNSFITTHNAIAADRHLAQLANRPKSEVPGLAVFYGPPGLGKTTWALATARIQPDHFYIRLKTADTTKAFLIRLLAVLTNGNYKLRDKTNISTLYEEIEEILAANPHYVIFIDEVDIAFERSYRVLKLLRDLADTTYATYILIGMESLRSKIKNYSNHYFDRCYFSYEFSPATQEETRQLIDLKLGITASDTLAKRVWQQSQGTLRKTMKIIAEMELTLQED